MTTRTGDSKTKFLQVSATKPDCIRLRSYAGRIAGLLSDPTVVVDDDAVSTLDFFSGAIHSLFLARHHGFRDRKNKTPQTGPQRFSAPRSRVRKINEARWGAARARD
jgi:hypothetical protein